MTRWKYAVVFSRLVGDWDKKLTQMGNDGWELIGVTNDEGGSVWYFKRKKSFWTLRSID